MGASSGDPGTGGYSLVELVVVLAVMALAAAVVAPGLFHSEGAARERAIRMLSEVHARARQAAVAAGGEAQVWLNADDGRWVSLSRVRDGAGWDTLDSGSVQAPGLRLEVDGGPWTVFRFDARGRVSGTRVTARGPEGVVILHPDPWTGRLHVARR